VTTDTWQRRAVFSSASAAEIVCEKLFEYRERDYFWLHAFVVMPDHLHVLLTPGEETSLEKAVQMIKGGSSHALGRAMKLQFAVWHAGFTEHLVRDSADFEAHIRYIEQNPVKARLAETAEAYAYGSACRRERMDKWPVASGAKAPARSSGSTAGLKPRPSEQGRERGE
jgi:putative transposase